MPKYLCSTKEGHAEIAVEADDVEHAAVKYKSLVGLDGIGMPIETKEVVDSNAKDHAKNRRRVKDETTVTPEKTEGVALTGEETSDLDEVFNTPPEKANVEGTKALTTRERADQAKVEERVEKKAAKEGKGRSTTGKSRPRAPKKK
jgi:hypothetical protein